MDDLLELQEVDDFIPQRTDKITYPHVVIEGVTTEEEVIYFNKKFNSPNKALPLYLSFGDAYKCIGSFELTLDNLLVVRSIANYDVAIVTSADKKIELDLNNPDTFLKFIALCSDK